jgi:hypothetical protein
MTAVPPATPVTVPVVPTVAMPVLPLLQVPPEVTSCNIVVVPAHKVVVPVIPDGAASTVSVRLTLQLPPKE